MKYLKYLSSGAIVLLLGTVFYGSVPVPAYLELKNSYQTSDLTLRARDGQFLHRTRVNYKHRAMAWVNYFELPANLIKYVTAIEDKRFLSHHGVDWLGIGSAFKNFLTKGEARGASTITMQLMNKIERRGASRNPWYKVRQMLGAFKVEKLYSKQEIIEAYFNMITWRGELQGVDAASHKLFNKQVAELSDGEAFLLAVLLRSPSASIKNIKDRACDLALVFAPELKCNLLEEVVDSALLYTKAISAEEGIAPHLAQYIKNKATEKKTETVNGFLLKTSIDFRLQKLATQLVNEQMMALKNQNVQDAAVLMLNNKSGEIVAYVGGSGAFSQTPKVDMVQAKRQAGSTLKPFIYATAFEKKLITPASLLRDLPYGISTPMGAYKPENYDKKYHGWITAREALAGSINIPAINVFEMLGKEAVYSSLLQVGINNLAPSEFYGVSLALGTADVSLFDLTNAYRVLANAGKYSNVTYLLEQKNSTFTQTLISPEAAFLVSDILSDKASRAITFGLDNSLVTNFWSAAKTGTSKDMRDNWCVGFTTEYTLGVWVGNSVGTPMWNVSGVDGAAPVWSELMSAAHVHLPLSTPDLPPGIVKQEFSGQNEYFIKGTNQEPINMGKVVVSAKIANPENEAVYAIDPDIPKQNERIFFEALPMSRDFYWVLNSERLTDFDAKDIYFWKPKPGKHKLQLINKKNQVVDMVNFQVRSGSK